MEPNTSDTTNTLGYFKAVGILHLSFLVGQLLFAAIAAFMVFSHSVPPSLPDATIIRIGLIALAILCIGASQFIYNKRISETHAGQSVDEKLSAFRAAMLIRCALLEGPSLLSIILFLLTGSILYLCLALAIILWFALQYPFRSKVLSEIGLDELSLTDGKSDRY
jgi:hypothetical protein